MKKPEKAYLVTHKSTGKKRLIDASAPANAIAHCAKDDFQAQRLEGPALDVILDGMELESASSRNTSTEDDGTDTNTEPGK